MANIGLEFKFSQSEISVRLTNGLLYSFISSKFITPVDNLRDFLLNTEHSAMKVQPGHRNSYQVSATMPVLAMVYDSRSVVHKLFKWIKLIINKELADCFVS